MLGWSGWPVGLPGSWQHVADTSSRSLGSQPEASTSHHAKNTQNKGRGAEANGSGPGASFRVTQSPPDFPDSGQQEKKEISLLLQNPEDRSPKQRVESITAKLCAPEHVTLLNIRFYSCLEMQRKPQ